MVSRWPFDFRHSPRGTRSGASGSELARTAVALGLAALFFPTPGHPQAPPASAPAIVEGATQIVPAMSDSARWIRQELWVETRLDTDRDGLPDRVHVAVVRPFQTETEGLRVPVIFEASTYYAGTSASAPQFRWDVRHEVGERPPPRTSPPPIQELNLPGISTSHVDEWVPRGFAVVHASAPGTGLSQGCQTAGGPSETLAPVAVIDWLNGRAPGFTDPRGGTQVTAGWANGRVAMVGSSYDGTLALAAATTGVAGLRAVVAVSASTSFYRYYRSNGLVRHPAGWLGEDIDFYFDYVNSGDPSRRDRCATIIRDGELVPGEDRVTGDYNAFWAGRELRDRLGGIRAATFLAAGLNDWNVMPEHSVAAFSTLESQGTPVRLLLHQRGHGGWPSLEMMNRWLTRYLLDISNGVEEEAPVWVERKPAETMMPHPPGELSGLTPRLVTEGIQEAAPVPYPDFPNPESAPVPLYPTVGGIGAGGLERARGGSEGTETLVDNVSFTGGVLARAEWSNHRLVYASPVLSDVLHISGTPRVRIRVASSRPGANLSMWLVSLPWIEASTGPGGLTIPEQGGVITRGWADPQNHGSLTTSEPLVPGRFYELTFDLEPDDELVPPGQRIALVIMSSDRDFTLWPHPGNELTVDLDATVLELPVVGGPRAWERVVRRPE
jgi:X-Pro dipeptidyl-peptidase